MSVLLSRSQPAFLQCRWPVNEPDRSGKTGDVFGGQRICGALPSWPTSYCPAHRALVYQPAPRIRSVRDPASVRAAPEPDLQPELTEVFS